MLSTSCDGRMQATSQMSSQPTGRDVNAIGVLMQQALPARVRAVAKMPCSVHHSIETSVFLLDKDIIVRQFVIGGPRSQQVQGQFTN